MPVEIKELVIRAVVNQDGGRARGTGAREPEKGAETSEPDDREAVVAAAVREVLRILKSSKER